MRPSGDGRLKRDIAALSNEIFDVVVVGGGIHGAFAAWDAAMRGLRVALIERGDWGCATSSNSLKIAHGGLRHLQSGSISAVIESLEEQIALRTIAPHLVRPLPCVIETGGAFTRSPLALGAALAAYNTIVRSCHAPRNVAPERGRLLQRDAMQNLVAPLGLEWRSGAMWFDALIESPERLLIGVVRSAVAAGAVAASYVEAYSVATDTSGVTVSATSGGDPLEIRARMMLDATGASVTQLAGTHTKGEPVARARACNVVLRTAQPAAAISLRHPTEPRMLFAVPWRSRLMVGTSYRSVSAAPAPANAADAEADVQRLLDDFNAAVPTVRVSLDDVAIVHSGVLPAVQPSGDSNVQLLHHFRVAVEAGTDGRVVSLIGVKWTTARRAAEQAINLCQKRLGVRVLPSETSRQPIEGATASATFSKDASVDQHGPSQISLYGGLVDEINQIARDCPALAQPLISGTSTMGAQIAHAIRYEMALHLDDIVLRRSEMGTAGCPADAELTAAARIAARELAWSPETMSGEIQRVKDRYRLVAQ